MVNFGIALSIAGPAIMILLIIIGAIKARPYRNTDIAKFRTIYKPYKYTGMCTWIVCSVIGILIIVSS